MFQKKITAEDEENLKRGGTPEDIKVLLRPSVAVARRDSCGSESDDEDELSAETGIMSGTGIMSETGTGIMSETGTGNVKRESS